MVKGIYSAAKSMHKKMENIQIVANNLANMNSAGFKREIPFSEYFDRENSLKIKQLTDFTEGSLIETSNPLDFAITGKGFFTVNTDRGIELTKNGKFKLSDEGFLINEQGYRVQGTSGDINIYESMLSENAEINVSTNGELVINDVVVDSLKIVKVEDTKFLIRTDGQNFRTEEPTIPIADEAGFKIHQGYLEDSNSNAILEMQDMIKLNKDYEAAQKMIKSLDEIMRRSKDIGKV